MEYIADLHQQYKPKTIRRKIASVKAFCSYLEFEELIKENPFSRLRLKLSAPLILPRAIPLSAIRAILIAAYQMKIFIFLPPREIEIIEYYLCLLNFIIMARKMPELFTKFSIDLYQRDILRGGVSDGLLSKMWKRHKFFQCQRRRFHIQ